MRKNDAFQTLLGQLHLAGVLLTRLPLPHLRQEKFNDGSDAVWAYPVIGVFIGILGAVAAAVALRFGLPSAAAAGFALAAMMVATGAMHEDGLADTFDGFWGGNSPARRLEIMRDSHIGTYGVLSLIIVTGLRWIALTVLISEGIWPIIAAAALSRGAMPLIMANLPHARTEGLSQSVGTPSMQAAIVAIVIGFVSALLMVGQAAFWPLIAVLVLTMALSATSRTKIGGQTGDVLGATQQLCEVLVLIILCV